MPASAGGHLAGTGYDGGSMDGKCLLTSLFLIPAKIIIKL